MATSGFTSARIGIYDPDKETISKENIFTIEPEKKGSVVSASISNISPTNNPIYGSDSEWKIQGKGTGAITVAFVANAIAKADRQRMLGMTTYKGGFASIGQDTLSPYCVFEMISHDAEDESIGSRIVLVKGTFHLTTVAPKTNTNTTVYDQDQLTFTAEARKSDKQTYFEAIEDEEFDMSAWESKIYGMPLTVIDGNTGSSAGSGQTDQSSSTPTEDPKNA